ncbi:MAG: methyl-accepting chemotaxis protein [Ruminiclostridium sp.]|nr:methyl-accepting chemotaxis protein [Ruminiclostridium sp.]
MKTSMKKRMLRLGILCAGIGSFAVAIFAAIAMNIVAAGFAEKLGNTVIDSAVSSFREEVTYLSDGLRDAEPGGTSDIFDELFLLGEPQSYDYSAFAEECRQLSAGSVSFAYIGSADINLVAFNRGSDIIVGTLEGTYFDYAISIMGSADTHGYLVNNKNGKVVLATNKNECGSSIEGNSLYTNILAGVRNGKSVHEGGSFSQYVVFGAPLSSSTDYSVIYVSDSSLIYRGGKIATTAMIGWALVLTFTGVVVSIGVAKKITASIVPTAECLEKFSRGEIDTSFKANDRGDETEVLSQAMEKTIGNLGTYIRDIDFMLSEISQGNLTAQSSCEYAGDFNNIKRSLESIASTLKSTISAIRDAGEQVSSGVGSLASGAQSLANNSSTEAGTLKELDALVKNINENVTANAEMTDRMRGLSEQTVQNVETGNRNMQNLSEAIEDIRKASEEIQSIAKLIDDIAFQTNILALNAAVEAARAGEAGKGFAVVADEVRNLASKSAEAAKNAVQVIGRCVAAVDQGVQLNQSASQSLAQVSESVQEFSVLVGKVADSSSQQARDISTVNSGLTSITSVVQSNAATAEQSAASSEELASQAQVLEQQLRHFRV